MSDTTVPPTETRQQLHSIVRKEIPFETKALEVLEVGAEYLSMSCGYMTQIDTERDNWEVLFTTDSDLMAAGRHLSLEQTYCRQTIKTEPHYALHDAPAQGWADDQAVQATEHDAYLGVPLVVDEELFGTVCFVTKESRPNAFSDIEIWFIEHLSGLLERELARNQVEHELAGQTNLAAVLNRVLRHNLRNDITIIRGYTEHIANQLDDPSTIEPALRHIDDLVQLSQRARELQQIITVSADRRRTELGDFIENIADTIAQEFPEASLSVEYDSPIHTDVMSNFDRAIEELIRNAVKYSGDSPTVTVAIETDPNAIEISISDDGPGLPEQEAKVLADGEETPLAHGTGLGLWLAHWIVTGHDGSIEPAVTEDGTTMTISLPRKPVVSGYQQLTELSRSRDRYKASFDEAADAMIIADDEGQYIEVNDSATELFGVPETELLGRTIVDFTAGGSDFSESWQLFHAKDEEQSTIRLSRPDGSERIVEYTVSSHIVPKEHLIVFRDITGRRKRKQELETLLEAAPDPVFVADAHTATIIEVNTAAQTMLEKSRDDLVGQHVLELHPSEQAEQYSQLFDEHIESEGLRQSLPDGSQIHVVTENKNKIPVEISVGRVSLPDGPVVFGIFRDVTKRKERGQRARTLKNRLDLAIEAGGIGVWEWDIGSNTVEWDESMEQLLGMEPGSFSETMDAFVERVHPDDRDRVESEIESALATGDEVSYSLRMQTADRRYRWIETRMRVITDANGEPVRAIGVGIDITDHMERE